MARLSRAETQQRNRARVLAAAREEFAEKGFAAARIDDIAERADLTRGAVYSNFPGKRALYFAVLADLVERVPLRSHARPGRTVREALGAFAGTWVARLPLADQDLRAPLELDLTAEVFADESIRRQFRQLMQLDAVLLALALERLRPLPATPATPGVPAGRLVRLAETVLTTLHGASRLARTAPGFVEPFDVVSACEQLADLTLNDWWSPPQGVPCRHADEHWAPPGATDVVRDEPAALGGDGVVVFLGLDRLRAVEDVVRAVPSDVAVSAVLVTGDPQELACLTRLVVAHLCGLLRQAVPRSAWPEFQMICDGSGAVAEAAGVTADETTEAAIGVERGRIVCRADGAGAGYAVARAVARDRQRSSR